MAKGGLIHYVCIADAHISSVRQSTSDTLTVVSGRNVNMNQLLSIGRNEPVKVGSMVVRG